MNEIDLYDFYEAIHAPAGHRCLARPYRSNHGFAHYWADSTEDMLRKFGARLFEPSWFHSVATFRPVDAGDQLTDKQGQPIPSGALKRMNRLVLWSKCGHNEIDIRDTEDSYHDIDAAIRALEPVERELGQAALLVHSGGGLHIYWPYTESVDYKVWEADRVYRERLFKRFETKGHDAPVARDRSRLLRVPGSVNEKYGRQVAILGWHSGTRAPKAASVEEQQLIDSEAAANDRRYQTLTPQLVAETCAQVRQLRDNPAAQAYVEWLGCASILRYVPGGPEAFLVWSRGDTARFDPAVAEEKLHSLTGADAFKCATLLEASPHSICESCPHARAGSNALRQALLKVTPTPAATALDPALVLPSGYAMDGAQIVVGSGNRHGKGTLNLPVSTQPLYVDGLYVDPATEKKTALIRYQESDGRTWKETSLPTGKLSACLPILGEYITLTPRVTQYLFDSVAAYEQRIKAEGGDPLLPVINSIAWLQPKQGGYAFGYGKTVISERGATRVIHDKTNPRLTETVEAMEPMHSDPVELERLYQEWQLLACEYANDPSVPLACRCLFLLGFVAPTVRLVVEGHRFGGIIANVHGRTGWGKTLALKAAASIYGRPSVLIPPQNVSEAAAYHYVSCTPNLPAFVDEFTVSGMARSARQIHDFIKSFSDGASPGRMNADGTPRPSKTWNTICLSTSNERYLDSLRAAQGQEDVRAAEMRVAEFPLPSAEDKHQYELLRAQDYGRFDRLYGLAGPRWIRHLCTPRVQASLNAFVARYDNKALPPEARYLSKLLALAEWTCRELWDEKNPGFLADDSLGMVKFPARELFRFWVESQVAHVEDSREVHERTPLQQSILDFLDVYKSACAQYSRDWDEIRGEVPVAKRMAWLKPDNEMTSADVRAGKARLAFVTKIDAYLIPHNELMNFHNKRTGTRNFTAEITKLKGNVYKCPFRVRGYVDYERGEEPCWRIPRALIDSWR